MKGSHGQNLPKICWVLGPAEEGSRAMEPAAGKTNSGGRGETGGHAFFLFFFAQAAIPKRGFSW